VLVSNRKASVELHAILLKLDVVDRQKGKIALEERQVKDENMSCLYRANTSIDSDCTKVCSSRNVCVLWIGHQI
jgi:hypothetical protein